MLFFLRILEYTVLYYSFIGALLAGDCHTFNSTAGVSVGHCCALWLMRESLPVRNARKSKTRERERQAYLRGT